MSTLISCHGLRNVALRTTEAAELYSGIANRHLDDLEFRWAPYMEQVAKTRTTTNMAGLEDAHWNWRQKSKVLEPLLMYEGVALECEGQTQGMMWLRLDKYARLNTQIGRELVYIDYIASAPWNRLELGERRYRGVGHLLFGYAIARSLELGFHGRVGLVALPQAEAFYENKCGMHRCAHGDTSPSQLAYFELTADAAKAYTSITP